MSCKLVLGLRCVVKLECWTGSTFSQGLLAVAEVWGMRIFKGANPVGRGNAATGKPAPGVPASGELAWLVGED